MFFKILIVYEVRFFWALQYNVLLVVKLGVTEGSEAFRGERFL